MGKAVLLAIALYLFNFEITAQEKIFECERKALTTERFSYNVVEDKTNNFFIFSIITNRTVKRYYSRDGKTTPLLEQHISTVSPDPEFKYHAIIDGKFTHNYMRLRPAGSIYADKKIIEIMRHWTLHETYLFETDIQTGLTRVTDTIKTSPGEGVIDRLNINGQLYFFTFQDGTNKITIYHKGKDSLRITRLKIVYKDGDDSRGLKIQRKHFSVFTNNNRYDAILSAIEVKAFLQNDKMIIAYPKGNGKSYAAFIDIGKGEYSVREFIQSGNANSNLRGNSVFVIDSFFISASSSDKEVRLNIFNVNNGNLLHQKTIDESNIDSLLVSPIIRTGKFESKGDVFTSNFDKFYKTVRNNMLSVAGYSHNGTLFLSFGAKYKQVINGNTLMNMFSMVAGGLMMNASNNSNANYFQWYGAANVTTHTSFDVALSTDDFRPLKSHPNYFVWEKMAAFVQIRASVAMEYMYFYMNDFYYLGYYDLPASKFFVYRFDENGIE
jgi:hypothetical protein